MALDDKASTRIDAHCHYWQRSRGDYFWLTEDLTSIYRDFGAHDHDAASAGLGISQRVLVQAAPTVAETEFLLDCARSDAKATAAVGWVDLAAQSAEADLERLASNPMFKGIRPMLQDIADPDWINVAARPEAVARLAELGLRFDALAKPAQIGAVVTFAGAHTDLPIIVDHAGKPDLAKPETDPERQSWARAMAELAAMDHVYCKFSGLLNETAPRDRTSPERAATALEPVFHLLLGWFGADRLAWGSDWPVVNLAGDYGFWAETTDILLEPLSATEREAIFAGTAARFYGLENTP